MYTRRAFRSFYISARNHLVQFGKLRNNTISDLSLLKAHIWLSATTRDILVNQDNKCTLHCHLQISAPVHLLSRFLFTCKSIMPIIVPFFQDVLAQLVRPVSRVFMSGHISIVAPTHCPQRCYDWRLDVTGSSVSGLITLLKYLLHGLFLLHNFYASRYCTMV